MKSKKEIYQNDGNERSPVLYEAETILHCVEARAGLRHLEEDEAKLEALRSNLHASKGSRLIEDFDPQEFLVEMRQITRQIRI